MSDIDRARRTAVEVAFDGADITNSIRPYLLSATYTDNEEDEADDLQLRLQDRDSVWMCQWLNDAIQAAAATAARPEPSADGAKRYKVAPEIGLNVRSGPGTSCAKLGALVYGAEVSVTSIKNGWAAIDYNGKTAYVSAGYLLESGGGGGSGAGLKIQAALVRKNWHGDGKDKVLDCGQFELDSIEAAGPPSTITIKATSLPFSAQIRQTQKSKAWEAYTLSGIAREMAAANGMACLYESAADPAYARVEQYRTSDIDFLSQLCHDAGISLKATNNILVLFDQAAFEANPAVLTIRRGGGSYLKHRLSVGTADKQWTSCRVSYTAPETGRLIEAVAYVPDYKADAEKNQQLEVTAKVNSIAEAKALAEKRLRLHNKYERTATFTLPGDPGLVAGVTVMLEGWGAWDGKYIVKQAKHTAGSSGYTVQIRLRRVLEGY